MKSASLFQIARKSYYTALLKKGVLCMVKRKKPKKGYPDEFPSNADGDSLASIKIAQGVFDQIQSNAKMGGRLAGQISGSHFEQITRSFVEETFKLFQFSSARKKLDFNPEKRTIIRFEQYHHLKNWEGWPKENRRSRCSWGATMLSLRIFSLSVNPNQTTH